MSRGAAVPDPPEAIIRCRCIIYVKCLTLDHLLRKLMSSRTVTGGHKSGDWKVDDRIFQGRLRVVSIGELCELRLEETGRCCTDVASMLLCI